MKPATLWPVALGAVLALTVGANVAMYLAATAPDAAVVEPDYYRRAIAWDSTLAERARQARLGWSLAAHLAPGPAGTTRVQVALRDAGGAAIEGATITLVAFHDLEARRPRRAALAPAGDGYAADLPRLRPGRWELRLAAVARGERFTVVVIEDAP